MPDLIWKGRKQEISSLSSWTEAEVAEEVRCNASGWFQKYILPKFFSQFGSNLCLWRKKGCHDLRLMSTKTQNYNTLNHRI